MKYLPRLLRMKSEIRNDDKAAMTALEQNLFTELGSLEA